jgi:murein DD-endopeptidase MepM/ murein hydrolase activator NlpD
MPPLHRALNRGSIPDPAGGLRLAALLLAAGVILALGPGSAALAERVARAAQADSPAHTATPQPPSRAPTGPGPPGPGPPDPAPPVEPAWGQERVPPLRMPLAGPLVRGFEAAAGAYGPGHRGVDVGGRAGDEVRAPAGGRVAFAGPVAGVTWASLLVAPGVTVTVGPLLAAEVTGGQRVRLLAPVGRLGPGHGMTSHGTTLHLSLRVDGVYVDPLPYLVDRPRPRLAPLPSPGGLAGPDSGGP